MCDDQYHNEDSNALFIGLSNEALLSSVETKGCFE